MKTADDRMIKLDQTTLGPDTERAKKMMVYGPSLFPVLFILFPMYLLVDAAGVESAGLILLGAASGVFVAMTIYLKRLVDNDDPAVQHKGLLVFIHFRMFFVSAILFFLSANLSVVLISGVIVLWIFIEVHHVSKLRGVDDSAICEAYSVRFSKMDNGDWLYNSRAKVDGVIHEPWYYSKAAEAFLIPGLVIAGGFVFIRSFTLRDNFDVRYIIAGCVGLFLAMLVRSLITRCALDIRAVNLKAQGKF